MQKIIITGVSKWLGYALAKQFLANGCDVVWISRTKSDLDIAHIITDLTTKEWLQFAVEEIQRDHSDFACLINNLGDGKAEKIDDIDFDSADRAMKINLLTPLVLTTWLIKNIKKNEADIINIGATIWFKWYEHFTAYSSAKRGLRWFTENLQVELKKTKCRVIGVHPGGMETPGNTGKKGRQKQMSIITGNENTSIFIDPEQVAALVRQLYALPKNIEVSEIIINRK